MIKKILILSIFISAIFFSSCSEYQKVLKSNDRVIKYDKAMEYYDAGEWNKAQTIIEDILPVYKGTEKGEELLFKFAYCHYNMRDYILAGYYFRKFTQTFGNSKLEEEAAYKSAECYFLDSPRSSLDQSSTRNALSEIELFLIKHPHSKYVDQAKELRITLNNKLAEKQYNNSKHYLNLGYYISAITAFESCLDKFPYSKYREDILFDLLQTNYLFAKNSVSGKQKERFEETVKAYYKYIDEFSQGKNSKEATKMFNIAEKRSKELANNNSI